eukprot:4979482-Amphidinium_carterae.1
MVLVNSLLVAQSNLALLIEDLSLLVLVLAQANSRERFGTVQTPLLPNPRFVPKLHNLLKKANTTESFHS